jgi:pimeloyl-[acyl-carrier protein] synthase
MTITSTSDGTNSAAADTDLSAPPTPPDELVTELLSAGLTVDPYPIYRRFQREYPVADLYGTLVSVSRYQDVACVLRHPQASTDDRASELHQHLAAEGRFSPAYLAQLDERSFLHRDPPDHTRLRKLAARAFTPHRIEALRTFTQRQVDQALDNAAPAGRIELVEQLAWPLPIEVICELIGVPAEDRPFVATWPRAQLCCSFESVNGTLKAGQSDGSRQVEADRIEEQLASYFSTLIDLRRSQPGDDLVSALIAAHDEADRLTEEEINATLRLLFVAGYENAVNMVGQGILHLMRRPDQWEQLRDKPDLATGAVEEALRYDSPFQFTRRVVAADLELSGYRIEQGRHLILWLAAANRDPEQFPDPNRFDIHRTVGRHLAFGSGIHACFGGPLARLEGEIVFATLTRRLVEPRLELDHDTPRYRTDSFRSLAELQIEFSALR